MVLEEESEAGVTDEMMVSLENFMKDLFMGEEVDDDEVEVGTRTDAAPPPSSIPRVTCMSCSNVHVM